MKHDARSRPARSPIMASTPHKKGMADARRATAELREKMDRRDA